MKHHLLKPAVAALMLLAAGSAHAAYTLYINGVPVERTLSRITFSGDHAVLQFADATEEFDLGAVDLIFSTTGAADITTCTASRIEGDVMVVEGIDRADRAVIYDMGGHIMVTAAVTDGTARLPLAGINPGVYVMRAGNNIVKFIRP